MPAMFITEPPRKTPILVKADVIVVGGGPAGFAATLAARMQGVKTLVLEKNGFFGGTLTSATLGNICGLYSVTADGTVFPVVQGIATTFIRKLRENGYANQPRRLLSTATVAFDVTGMKFVMDDMVVESGADILFNVTVVGVLKEGDRIKGVLVESRGGRGFIEGQVFIDATGDGDLFAQAGVQEEFSPGDIQYGATTFSFCNVDTEKAAGLTRQDMGKIQQQAVIKGKYRLSRLDGGYHLTPVPGIAHCNVTRVAYKGRPVNPLDPFELTYGELEGRRQVREYERVFKDWMPGFAQASVCNVGNNMGIREARCLKGDYTLAVEDITACRRFNDAVACSSWPLEIHGQGAETKWVWVKPGDYYQIPFRALFSSKCPNLLVAGRCISATHEAQASVRVAGICLATGEAAGTAAGLMCREKRDVTGLNIEVLQEQLKAQGAFLGR